MGEWFKGGSGCFMQPEKGPRGKALARDTRCSSPARCPSWCGTSDHQGTAGERLRGGGGEGLGGFPGGAEWRGDGDGEGNPWKQGAGKLHKLVTHALNPNLECRDNSGGGDNQRTGAGGK